jgi:lipoprotein-anchoring transpeptidase ErfK/SrfK
MKTTFKAPAIIIVLGLLLAGCEPQVQNPGTAARAAATPTASPVTSTATEAVPITLPVLDALLADEAFKADLKSKLQLTDEQIVALRKISSEEVGKLRHSNAEPRAGDAEAARQKAIESIRGVISPDKSDQLLALARDRWNKGSEELQAAAAKEPEPTMLTGPNAVPKDTRIVVNIPAFRMDVFSNGRLVKSYKIGIGYPQFPLPQGLRNAQQIIFNPTWTPPDEPWVASMKGVAPGESVAAGSKLNPLGPIKIPIGAPSLIHGGKPLAKIGAFASHGCVGMTNSQVKDFAAVLAKASETELSEETVASYLKRRNKTQVVQLTRLVPVELRYETIVFEDGQLHIYRDVYDRNTNTEENLRAVFTANGASFDDLKTEEKAQVLEALNAMSLHPKKQPTPKPTVEGDQNPADKIARANERKAEAERQKKLREQRESVIEIVALAGKGYPAPVDLDSGTGMQATVATAATKKLE